MFDYNLQPAIINFKIENGTELSDIKVNDFTTRGPERMDIRVSITLAGLSQMRIPTPPNKNEHFEGNKMWAPFKLIIFLNERSKESVTVVSDVIFQLEEVDLLEDQKTFSFVFSLYPEVNSEKDINSDFINNYYTIDVLTYSTLGYPYSIPFEREPTLEQVLESSRVLISTKIPFVVGANHGN
ncbi:hypothetical protein BJM49_11490 [Listeria monocytogenes]|uniref:hypothetical protein n=1 Tax=Listeria monocytogenes TaxID=1639 RepID=UPI00087579C1|nr:hypothetical protein [Listeria monocytogenes]EAC3172477.1 hypothetical protein [Listeria monocytogenes]EAD2563113.1 hypothetical protein [Listeria monocytogenes]EAD3582764.1 hypothetical protein [Listeria monocytogenes]EAD9074499.1 hypothetical protein [Listeria monocytogenes]EAD9142414.1 hypothetical protein [Listeria monocytogenes]